VLVNGTDGTVHFDPDAELLAQSRHAQEAVPAWDAAEETTLSPVGPRVEANVNLLIEAAPAALGQAQGVGLYRSEFLFLARRTLPTEEEQVTIYRKLLHLLGGRPVTIRTFDLRPDKLAHFSHWNRATSRPYDWRLVLESPPMQRLFKDQVRAILRAAAEGPARLLVPLVTYSAQVDFILETIDRAGEELEHEGLEHSRRVPLGLMIETAAATAMVGAWARRADFFALGTNDLVASALGIDRSDPVGEQVPDPLHPGVLHLVHDVVSAAHRHGRRVTVCGELAADAEGTLALSALGVDSLSVAVNQLRVVRRNLATVPAGRLAGLAEEVGRMRSAAEVRGFLRRGT
jgi:phosphoenolpyruvate-protein kinase (PTS system EI component)